MPEQVGLYVHIPFCRAKCAYCDFLSEGAASPARMEEYFHALLAELRHARATALRGREIDTIYIGGGTPTALPASFLCEIIAEAKKNHMTSYDLELTVECNPASTDGDYLRALRGAGANRLSIGLQAWQDELLGRICRPHTQREFLQTFRAARAAGFENINVDVMFALPGQTLGDWRETLTQLAALAPEHISAYALTPAEGTPLWEWLEAGTLTLPDDETDRAMYREAQRVLSGAGYTRYEISNFAMPDRESRHNVNTWRRHPYLGFGLGAHSFDTACGGFGARWHNTEDMDEYLHARCAPAPDTLTLADAMAEFMFLGLRMTEGVSEADFRAAFARPLREVYGTQITQLTTDGFLAQKKGRIFLTPLGTDLANRVMAAFI